MVSSRMPRHPFRCHLQNVLGDVRPGKRRAASLKLIKVSFSMSIMFFLSFAFTGLQDVPILFAVKLGLGFSRVTNAKKNRVPPEMAEHGSWIEKIPSDNLR